MIIRRLGTDPNGETPQSHSKKKLVAFVQTTRSGNAKEESGGIRTTKVSMEKTSLVGKY